MKEWRRMCAVYSTDDDDCCKGCPMLDLDFDEHGCDAIFSDWSKAADWKKVEDTINEWAAEHPEPVYPTWSEWLYSVGVFEDKPIPMPMLSSNGDTEDCNIVCHNIATSKADEPIPSDIAQKLGLQPKEG
jgi:hypothetical protein